MNGAAAISCLLAASLCTGIGYIRIGAWLIARRERDASAATREAAFVAQARAQMQAQADADLELCMDLDGEGWS